MGVNVGAMIVVVRMRMIAVGAVRRALVTVGEIGARGMRMRRHLVYFTHSARRDAAKSCR